MIQLEEVLLILEETVLVIEEVGVQCLQGLETLEIILFVPLEYLHILPHLLAPLIDPINLGLQFLELRLLHDKKLPREETRNNLRDQVFGILEYLYSTVKSILDLKAVFEIERSDLILRIHDIDAVLDLNLKQFHNELRLPRQRLLRMRQRLAMRVLKLEQTSQVLLNLYIVHRGLHLNRLALAQCLLLLQRRLRPSCLSFLKLRPANHIFL